MKLSAPTLEVAITSVMTPVVRRQAAEGRSAEALAVEQERIHEGTKLRTGESFFCAMSFCGARKHPYRAGPVFLDSCCSSHKFHIFLPLSVTMTTCSTVLLVCKSNVSNWELACNETL